MRRLLVVENDREVRALLARELRARDFDVLAVGSYLPPSGVAGQPQVQPEAVALAVDDTNDTIRGGWPLAFGAPVPVPVMYLIPRHRVADELPDFRTGIDDYLIRPFDYAELAVRLRLIIRGRNQAAAAYDGLWLDPVNRVVAYRFANVHLSPTEYRVMARLLVDSRTLVAREQLRAAAWPDNPAASNNLIDRCVSQLRRKLREIGAPHLIAAVRGVGYEFMPPPPRKAS